MPAPLVRSLATRRFEPEIGLPILGAIDGGLQFAMQSLLLTTELGRSVAQLVDGDQLLLIGVDQAADALADPDKPVPQVSLALLVGIGRTGRLQSPVDLGADQRRTVRSPQIRCRRPPQCWRDNRVGAQTSRQAPDRKPATSALSTYAAFAHGARAFVQTG